MHIKKTFQYFKEKTGIEIPHVIQEIYLKNERKKSGLQRLLNSHIDLSNQGEKPYLITLISENFASEIIRQIELYPKKERETTVINEIFKLLYDDRKIKYDTNVDDFVFDEILYSANEYNYIDNTFKFPIVQKAYENIGSDINEIKVVLITWATCGGEGGLIIRGKNTGFDCGMSELSEIKHKERYIEYHGFSQLMHEKPHQALFDDE